MIELLLLPFFLSVLPDWHIHPGSSSILHAYLRACPILDPVVAPTESLAIWKGRSIKEIDSRGKVLTNSRLFIQSTRALTQICDGHVRFACKVTWCIQSCTNPASNKPGGIIAACWCRSVWCGGEVCNRVLPFFRRISPTMIRRDFSSSLLAAVSD